MESAYNTHINKVQTKQIISYDQYITPITSSKIYASWQKSLLPNVFQNFFHYARNVYLTLHFHSY